MNLFDYAKLSFKDTKIKNTNLGIAYIGNKRALSCDLLRFIDCYYPQVKTIYDLFGGAGGFAFNALANGYEVIYNELAEYPFNLVKFVTKHDSIPREALQFCSREEFKAIKAKENKTPIDFIKLFAYSFRCSGLSYFCSPQKEFLKKQAHNMLVFQDENAVGFWNNYFKTQCLFDEFLNFRTLPLKKRLEIYTNTMLKIESLSVTNLLQRFQKEKKAYTISDFLNTKSKEVAAYIEANMPPDTPLKAYKTKRYDAQLDDMRLLQRLQGLQGLEQLEQKGNINIFNLDYREVNLPQPQDNRILIYCDIPYKNKSDEYQLKFNHKEFYEWALKKARQGYNILISEYDMPLSDFECVYYKEILNPHTKSKSCEKVFAPKIKKNNIISKKPLSIPNRDS